MRPFDIEKDNERKSNRREATYCPARAGSAAWRAWWENRPAFEAHRYEDTPPRCAHCWEAALVLYCAFDRDRFGRAQVERWCRCVRCGRCWREFTSLLGAASDREKGVDAERPWRQRVLHWCIEETSLGAEERRPRRGVLRGREVRRP